MFINKAQNLSHLSKFKISNVEIPKFIFFNVGEWKTNKNLLIHKVMKIRELRLAPRKFAWNVRRIESDGKNDISAAVDWSERAVIIGFDDGKFSHERSITLYLHEFEYLLASAKGLRSALFFAAEKDKFLGRLEKIGDNEEIKSDEIRIAYENKILDFDHSHSGQLLGGES